MHLWIGFPHPQHTTTHHAAHRCIWRVQIRRQWFMGPEAFPCLALLPGRLESVVSGRLLCVAPGAASRAYTASERATAQGFGNPAKI